MAVRSVVFAVDERANRARRDAPNETVKETRLRIGPSSELSTHAGVGNGATRRGGEPALAQRSNAGSPDQLVTIDTRVAPRPRIRSSPAIRRADTDAEVERLYARWTELEALQR
jgi:hypothetical protein